LSLSSSIRLSGKDLRVFLPESLRFLSL